MVLWSPGHQSFPFWSTMRLMATTQTLHLSLSDGKACPPRLLQPGTQQQVFTMKYDCPYSREREGWKTQPIWRTCVAWPATQRHLTATGRIMAAVPKSLIVSWPNPKKLAKDSYHQISNIQSSAVITWSNIVRYCINDCRNSGRISVRC